MSTIALFKYHYILRES